MTEGENATPHNALEHKPGQPFVLHRGRTDRGIWSQIIIDCSCGWLGPICPNMERAKSNWNTHYRASR